MNFIQSVKMCDTTSDCEKILLHIPGMLFREQRTTYPKHRFCERVVDVMNGDGATCNASTRHRTCSMDCERCDRSQSLSIADRSAKTRPGSSRRAFSKSLEDPSQSGKLDACVSAVERMP